MTFSSSWFQPPKALVTAWMGQDGELTTMLEVTQEPASVPVVIGPRGPAGPPGLPGPSGVMGSLGLSNQGDGILISGGTINIDIEALPWVSLG